MNDTKDIKTIEDELKDVQPGTILMIRGYVNSSGDKQDLEVELLDDDAYIRIQKEDLEILERSDVGDLQEGQSGDLALTDLITARDQLIKSKTTSLSNRENKVPVRPGPAYINVGSSGSLARLADQPGALYLRGLKRLGDIAPPKPARGAVPRAKQKIAEILELPSRRYIHSIKLEEGKFESLSVFVGSGGQ